MLGANTQKTHNQPHISLMLALLVLTGAAILGPVPAAFTAPSSAIWSAPVNLGSAINSAANDQQPAISPDGLSLYFASARAGIGGFDIYVSQRASVYDPWGSPVNLGATVNTTSDEGNPAFSRDGHLMFFQSRRPGGLGGIDIWLSQRNNPHDDFDWQPAVNLGPAINSAVDDNGLCYFEDEVRGTRQLYFGSARPGVGGTDIYVSEQMADGSFAAAVLVPELNSLQNENDPSIRPDGLEMFFQSNRTGSMGTAFDLWVATRASTLDAWSAPVNVGDTINTGVVDNNPNLSSDGMTLFFASDRPSGFGATDLYMSTRTLPTVSSKNISVAADDSCAANIIPSDVDDGSFDPVSGGPLTLSLDPAGPFSLGPHTVRLVATDNRGVTNSSIATVTVVDQAPPTITAPSGVNANTGGGGSNLAGAFVSDALLGNASANDACSTVQITRGAVPAGNFFPVGVTIITYTASDAAGNSVDASQMVTVIDDTAPVVTPPADITMDAISPAGAPVNYVVTASDNVGVTSLNCAPVSGSVFPIGTTLVQCTAQDAAGNHAGASFQVRVRGAAEQIVALIQLASGRSLPPAIAAQLLVALQRALSNPRNLPAACRSLDLFITLVRAHAGRSIPVARATQLIADATRIKAVLGCHC